MNVNIEELINYINDRIDDKFKKNTNKLYKNKFITILYNTDIEIKTEDGMIALVNSDADNLYNIILGIIRNI